MTYQIEEPVVHGKKDDTMGEYETHPAYGQITVSRVSGNSYLYGSDFQHQHYVVVGIHESKLNRTLSRDWPFSGKGIVEVAMTEAQWATFVSSFNQGGGTQCTLTRREGVGMVPGLPQPKRTEKFKTEFAEELDDIKAALGDVLAKLEAGTSGMPKGKAAALLAPIKMAMRTVDGSIPFLNSQFEEHMETVIEHSKMEVEGYLNSRVQRLGLAALGQQDVNVAQIDRIEPSNDPA
jgi:uncharacterized protein YndB with AHSA1/START domain